MSGRKNSASEYDPPAMTINATGSILANGARGAPSLVADAVATRFGIHCDLSRLRFGNMKSMNRPPSFDSTEKHLSASRCRWAISPSLSCEPEHRYARSCGLRTDDLPYEWAISTLVNRAGICRNGFASATAPFAMRRVHYRHIWMVDAELSLVFVWALMVG